jgi:hypothetical protein
VNRPADPWWAFSPFDVVLIAALLVAFAWLVGPPQGWGWLVLPPSVFAGWWLSRAAVPWAWRKVRP